MQKEKIFQKIITRAL